MLFLVIELNTFFNTITPSLTITIIGPFIEEFARFISLLFGSSMLWFYTIISSLYEFFIYVIFYYDENNELPLSFLLIRILCVGLHITAASIQLVWYNYWKKYRQISYLVKGVLLAYLLHVAWNGIISSVAYYILIQIC